jgi:hypothetical protein
LPASSLNKSGIAIPSNANVVTPVVTAPSGATSKAARTLSAKVIVLPASK